MPDANQHVIYHLPPTNAPMQPSQPTFNNIHATHPNTDSTMFGGGTMGKFVELMTTQTTANGNWIPREGVNGTVHVSLRDNGPKKPEKLALLDDNLWNAFAEKMTPLIDQHKHISKRLWLGFPLSFVFLLVLPVVILVLAVSDGKMTSGEEGDMEGPINEKGESEDSGDELMALTFIPFLLTMILWMCLMVKIGRSNKALKEGVDHTISEFAGQFQVNGFKLDYFSESFFVIFTPLLISSPAV